MSVFLQKYGLAGTGKATLIIANPSCLLTNGNFITRSLPHWRDMACKHFPIPSRLLGKGMEADRACDRRPVLSAQEGQAEDTREGSQEAT